MSDRDIETTSEPVEVTWRGGMDNTHTVRVNPYDGRVIVNGRTFAIGSLISQDVPDWMFRSSPEPREEPDDGDTARDIDHDDEQSDSKVEQAVTKEEIEAWEEEHDKPHPAFEVNHRPERSRAVVGDVSYCPDCGTEIDPDRTEFKEDLVLNRYRTEFICDDCGYHGEVFRHE